MGGSAGVNSKTDLVIDAAQEAVAGTSISSGASFHSDRGTSVHQSTIACVVEPARDAFEHERSGILLRLGSL